MAVENLPETARTLLIRAGRETFSPRPCRPEEAGRITEIVNAAAQAYRGVIPADCWHDPYMPESEMMAELASDVAFWGIDIDARLAAVMGRQSVEDVTLIRHAYVMPRYQSRGAGRLLLDTLRRQAAGRVLVGTWASATWAISFYIRNGFAPAGRGEASALLRRYWTVSERQIETSVVLIAHDIQRALS